MSEEDETLRAQLDALLVRALPLSGGQVRVAICRLQKALVVADELRAAAKNRAAARARNEGP